MVLVPCVLSLGGWSALGHGTIQEFGWPLIAALVTVQDNYFAVLRAVCA